MMVINNAVRKRQLQEGFADMSKGMSNLSEILNETADSLNINDLSSIMFNLQNMQKNSDVFSAEYYCILGKFSRDYKEFLKKNKLVRNQIKDLINKKYEGNLGDYLNN